MLHGVDMTHFFTCFSKMLAIFCFQQFSEMEKGEERFVVELVGCSYLCGPAPYASGLSDEAIFSLLYWDGQGEVPVCLPPGQEQFLASHLLESHPSIAARIESREFAFGMKNFCPNDTCNNFVCWPHLTKKIRSRIWFISSASLCTASHGLSLLLITLLVVA